MKLHGASRQRACQHRAVIQPAKELGPALHIPAQAQHHAVGRADFDQGRAQIGQPRQPRRGVQLKHQEVCVPVDHQAGQTVVFAMNQAIAGGAMLDEGGAPGCRRRQFLAQPGPVDGRRRAVLQHPHPDRRRGVIQADGEEAPPLVEDHRQIAGPALALPVGDGLVEEPGMAGPQGALTRRRHPERQPTFGRRWDGGQRINGQHGVEPMGGSASRFGCGRSPARYAARVPAAVSWRVTVAADMSATAAEGRGELVVSGRRRRPIVEVGEGAAFEFLAQHPLHIAHRDGIFRRHQRVRLAGLLGAAGAPDAMRVRVGGVGHVIVDDVRNAQHVDAARRDVGGNHDAVFAGPEAVQRRLPLILREVALERRGVEAGLIQLLGQPLGAMLGAGEHEHRFGLGAAQQLGQQRRLEMLRHRIERVRDRLDRRAVAHLHRQRVAAARRRPASGYRRAWWPRRATSGGARAQPG